MNFDNFCVHPAMSFKESLLRGSATCALKCEPRVSYWLHHWICPRLCLCTALGGVMTDVVMISQKACPCQMHPLSYTSLL